jgi:hypothetical protein
MPNPKVIFIDWNQTLSASHFWRSLPNVETVMFLANRHLLDPWMRGDCTAEEICQVLAGQTGISQEVIFSKLKESCETMEFVDDEVPGLIERIKAKGIKVVLATDNMDCFSRFTVPALRLDRLFDGLLISCDLKILKNEIRDKEIIFFTDYFRQNDLCYAEAVLLDDSARTSKEYWQLGFPVIIIDDKEKLLEVLRGFAGEGDYHYE